MMNETELDTKKLESFVQDEDLEKLEKIVNEFNIFKALNIIKEEIRHSNFLSWLLDPQENHGLSDYFLKLFLKRVCSKARDLGNEAPSVVDIDTWDCSETEILREFQNIDILIKDEKNNFVCAIENKIETKEHSEQLSRYKKFVDNEFPKFRKVFVFLTPEGDIPSDPSDQSYIPLKYSEVNESIKYLLSAKDDSLNEIIKYFILHYNKILERYIMPDSAVAELCEKIYKKHKDAIEIIYENKPDTQSEISEILMSIIKSNKELVTDESTKSAVRFITKSIDEKIKRKGNKIWVKSERILLFEFVNKSDGLKLCLIIGPGDDSIRKKIYDVFKESDIFKKTRLYDKWTRIYSKEFLSRSDLESNDLENLKNTIKEKFDDFVNSDMKKINDVITKSM